jgi:dGTPase
LRMMPGAFDAQADSVYSVLLGCCAYVASLSDGRALHLHQRIQGKIKV